MTISLHILLFCLGVGTVGAITCNFGRVGTLVTTINCEEAGKEKNYCMHVPKSGAMFCGVTCEKNGPAVWVADENTKKDIICCDTDLCNMANKDEVQLQSASNGESRKNIARRKLKLLAQSLEDENDAILQKETKDAQEGDTDKVDQVNIKARNININN